MSDNMDMAYDWMENNHDPFTNRKPINRRPSNYDSKGYRKDVDPNRIYSVKIQFHGTGTMYTFMMYASENYAEKTVKFAKTKSYSQLKEDGSNYNDMKVHSFKTGRAAMIELADVYELYNKVTMFQPNSATSYWDASMGAADLMGWIGRELNKKKPVEFIEIW